MPSREWGTPDAVNAAVKGGDHVSIAATERAYRRAPEDAKTA
jgi:hypothetical protein